MKLCGPGSGSDWEKCVGSIRELCVWCERIDMCLEFSDLALHST